MEVEEAIRKANSAKMRAERAERNWGVYVSKRLDRLTKNAAETGGYATPAEFIRSAVKKVLATLETDTEVDDTEGVEWSIRVPEELNNKVKKAIKTGAFSSKAELIRYAVRQDIKRLLPKTKL
jgi:Arc/MetJ-type ribon-helix-helix transcriptional regulator